MSGRYYFVGGNMKQEILQRFIKLIDSGCITIPFAVCWFFYYGDKVVSPYYNRGNWLIIFLFFILYSLLGKLYQAYLVSIFRISEIIYSQILSAFLANAILYIIICLLTKNFPNIFPLLLAFLAQIAIASVWTTWTNHWYFKTHKPKATAIIYDTRVDLKDLIISSGLKKYDVQITVNIRECIANISMLENMKMIFLTDISSHERNIIIKYCIGNGIPVMLIPRIGDTLMSSAMPIHMFHLPMLSITRYRATPEYLFAKRFFDIFLSGIALIILSPVFILTAIAVKSDGGPAFYKQIRLTKDGKKFNLVKFRSMKVDAEKDGVARLSTGTADDRITKVGRFIRKVRIDELPQIWLIFIGQMSLVGPRPERPEIANQYEKYLPEFKLRLQAKAGLTGYAQVYGKYNTTPYDKLQMDLMYIAHPSLAEDAKIILATIKILFIKESTEGVAEGQTTAEAGKPEIEESVGQESVRKTV